jgi:hypothetical protein
MVTERPYRVKDAHNSGYSEHHRGKYDPSLPFTIHYLLLLSELMAIAARAARLPPLWSQAS